MAPPSKIADFTILPLQYVGAQHFLYLTRHKHKKGGSGGGGGKHRAELPHDRTLFVVNIPPDATAQELTMFFSPSCGHVERVVFQRDAWSPEEFATLVDSEAEEDEEVANDEHEDPEEEEEKVVSDESEKDVPQKQITKNGTAWKKQKDRKKPVPKLVHLPEPDPPLRTFRHTGSSAHIIFADESSVTKALELRSSVPDNERVWPPLATTTTEKTAPSGLAHYMARYAAQRPAFSQVKAHADSYLEVYEYNKALTARRQSEYKKGEAIVDEDGFTLVTRGGAYGQTVGGGVAVASKRFMKSVHDGRGVKPGRRNKKKAKPHEKDNFYKFQVHEQKRKELVDLKAEFEKDKERIAELQASRRFKPY